MNEKLSSATAYEKLSTLTQTWEEGQVRLQELRVLTRALRTLAATYCTEANVDAPMGQAIVTMTDAAGVERNRLYQEASRLSEELSRLNGLIQNGVFNALPE